MPDCSSHILRGGRNLQLAAWWSCLYFRLSFRIRLYLTQQTPKFLTLPSLWWLLILRSIIFVLFYISSNSAGLIWFYIKYASLQNLSYLVYLLSLINRYINRYIKKVSLKSIQCTLRYKNRETCRNELTLFHWNFDF